ncbi:MAG: hypothetical protein JRH20_17275 [Deltaproteobacteria bacterium]|nr:hypothetical protein [Deltaproteobacteria bacterium]
MLVNQDHPNTQTPTVDSIPTASFCLADTSRDDPDAMRVLQDDMEGCSSPLELLHEWSVQLNRRAAHGELATKLDALFRHGIAPRELSGFHHGITLSMCTGLDAFTWLSALGRRLGVGEGIDLVQLAFGLFLSRTNPWTGKAFSPLSSENLEELSHGAGAGDGAMQGINQFRRVRHSFTNAVALRALPWMMSLEELPPGPPWAMSWRVAKGGHFIARQAPCVDSALSHKTVLDLNYRWDALGNGFGTRLLRDQLVTVAPGLYLGKLFYATEKLSEPYDPTLPDSDYAYRSFGYFLLLHESWRQEKDRLFPELAYP